MTAKKKTNTRSTKTKTRSTKSPRDKAREAAQRLLNQKFVPLDIPGDPNGALLMATVLEHLQEDVDECITYFEDENPSAMFRTAIRLEDHATQILALVANFLRNTDQKTRDLAIAEAFGPAK
jgi:hypothetical protein